MMNSKSICLLTLIMTLFNCTPKNEAKPLTLFVGTYTDTESEGIYALQFDSDQGKITGTTLAAKITSPSFLAVNANKDRLYAVQEVNDFEDGAGAITAFSMVGDTLREMQTISSQGAHPCHVGLSPSGKRLAVANYSGGNASLYEIVNDGTLTGPVAVMDHREIDTTKTSHAHMAQWVNDELYIADLGLDALLGYTEGQTGMERSKTLQLPAGAGPRHFTSTANGRFLYIINELNSSISVFEREGTMGYRSIQNESTLAPYFKGKSYCADVHISDDGRFLYGSNRGENTIVIFAIDQETGLLSLVGRESVNGDWPRNFTLDPTGKFLLVANQKSNNICVFRRDVEKGTLTFLNEEQLSKPVCLLFL